MNNDRFPIFGFAGRAFVGIFATAQAWLTAYHDVINSWLQTANLLISLVIGVVMLVGMLYKLRGPFPNTIREFLLKLAERFKQ